MRDKPVVIPHQDNPGHVENLVSISLLKGQGFQGMDASLTESLFEYGLVWRELSDGQTLFVYRHPNYAGRFDRCTLASDTDAKREWNWVDWTGVFSFLGIENETEWLELPLAHKVSDLLNYYGAENIFGSSYWEGFEVQDN